MHTVGQRCVPPREGGWRPGETGGGRGCASAKLVELRLPTAPSSPCPAPQNGCPRRITNRARSIASFHGIQISRVDSHFCALCGILVHRWRGYSNLPTAFIDDLLLGSKIIQDLPSERPLRPRSRGCGRRLCDFRLENSMFLLDLRVDRDVSSDCTSCVRAAAGGLA